jgi:hypothetical protein
LNIEGNWIIEVYENNLKMMSSTRDASLETRNVAHGVAMTGMKVDVEHMPWLASRDDPQLSHFVPILSPR